MRFRLFYTIGLTFLVPSVISGQAFTIQPDTSVVSANTQLPSVMAFSYVYNHSNDTLQLIWHRDSHNIPNDWGVTVCDEWICYDDTVLSAPMSIPPGDSAVLVGHFYHSDVLGTGILRVSVYDPSDSVGTTTQGTYIVNITETPTGISNSPGSGIYSVYPNPIQNQATLEYSLAQEEKISIQLVDISGKLVKIFIDEELRLEGEHQEVLAFPESIPAGHYMLMIDTGSKNRSMKVIVQ